MTNLHEQQQCDGPHAPTCAQLQVMLRHIPGHISVTGVVVNAKACVVYVQTQYEGLRHTYAFKRDEFQDILP